MNFNIIVFTNLFIYYTFGQDPTGIGADLVLDQPSMQQSMYISTETYTHEDCEINECLMHLKGGTFPTTRKLLRFDTRAANIGNRDFNLGNPFNNENHNFVFDPCHNHYHFENFAEYTVYSVSDTSRTTNLVPETGKRAFCLMDSAPAPIHLFGSSRSRRSSARFNCAGQGISVGWQDIYGANLDCQFVDITDLPDGEYRLVVTLNPIGALNEIDRTNNEAVLTFSVGSTSPPPGEQNCRVTRTEWLGDGYCDRDGRYNTAECNWDHGDCCQDCCRNGAYTCGSNGYHCLDTNCNVLETPEIIEQTGAVLSCNDLVDIPQWVGDGYCDGIDYNIPECQYDGGDCCESSCPRDTLLPGASYHCGEGGYSCLQPGQQ